MIGFKNIINAKNNKKEELETFYEMTGLNSPTHKKTSEEKTRLKAIKRLLKWNKKIERLEEGKEGGHTLRVAYLSKKMAEATGLDKNEVEDVYFAALFHDIGKHLISPKIIGKPGPLTDDEYKIMKKHTVLAENLVKGTISDSAVEIIKSHHERMDGSGYPKGIVPEISARILGLVDSYDAMTSNRVYSMPKNKDVTFQELERCTIPREEGGMGYLYDKELVKKLKELEKHTD